MAKRFMTITAFAFLCLIVAMIGGKESRARVKYSLNKGTLTVRGNGAATRVYKGNKKIKKVVVKKGVTKLAPKMFQKCTNLTKVTLPNGLKKIGRYAFAGTAIKTIKIPKTVKTIYGAVFNNCKKLNDVTMPGDFNGELIMDDEGDNYYDPIMAGSTNPNIIRFNTNYNLEISPMLRSQKLIVRKKDPKYTSINGAVYTKDGKTFIRAGAGVKNLVIADGCETVYASGFLYGYTWGESEQVMVVTDLSHLVIPETVKDIIFDNKYGEVMDDWTHIYDNLVVEIKTDHPSLFSVENLLRVLGRPKNDWVTSASAYFKIEDGLLLSADGMYVYQCVDDRTEIVIPEGVKAIDEDAFYATATITKVTLPQSMSVIGGKAFMECYSLSEVVIPEGCGIKQIDEAAFMGCRKLDPQPFLNITTLDTIQSDVFLRTAWEKLFIPKHITNIDPYAFSSVLIQGDPSPYVTFENEAGVHLYDDSFVEAK